MVSKFIFSGLLIRKASELILTLLSLCGVFAVWYFCTKYKLSFYIRFANIPTPHDVWVQTLQVFLSSDYLMNIYYSMKRILLGFIIATFLGVSCGVVIGKYNIIYRLTMPAIEILRPIPAIAWVPLSIMLWPGTESSIVFITFLGAFFPILVNTLHGVNSMDNVLLRAAKSLGAGEFSLLIYVILPGILPPVFTGLEIGMGVAWVSLIAAEMIAGQFGVGYFTWESYSLVNYPSIVLGMITIGVLGLICSSSIRFIGRRVMPWLAYTHGSKHGGA